MMAVSAGTSTSASKAEDKWSFCGVCKRNHEDGRKHIFSKHHKAKLSEILSKFSKKVRSARRCLNNPGVVDGELEPGDSGKMWCYCCEKEIQKHITNERVSVKWGGLLEHMTETEHHKRTRRYWWLNGADSTQLQTFLIFPAEYRRFKELALEALSKLEQSNSKRIKQLADELRAQEEHHSLIALEPPSLTQKDVSGRSQRKEKRVSWSAGTKRAASTSSHNFTSIKRKPVPGFKGNVHTGATPPWLRDDCDDDEGDAKSPLIGPSLEAFILHRETKKRAGRNPNRVGADFHIKLATQPQPDSDDWLPAFGRVWNHGPRFHSKKEFLSEVNNQEVGVDTTIKSPHNGDRSEVQAATNPCDFPDTDVSKSQLSFILDINSTTNHIHEEHST